MSWGSCMILPYGPKYYAQRMTIAITGIPNAMIEDIQENIKCEFVLDMSFGSLS